MDNTQENSSLKINHDNINDNIKTLIMLAGFAATIIGSFVYFTNQMTLMSVNLNVLDEKLSRIERIATQNQLEGNKRYVCEVLLKQMQEDIKRLKNNKQCSSSFSSKKERGTRLVDKKNP